MYQGEGGGGRSGAGRGGSGLHHDFDGLAGNKEAGAQISQEPTSCKK